MWIIKTVLGWLWSPLKWVLAWLQKDTKNIVIAGFAALALLFWLRLDAVATDRDAWKVASGKWKDATFSWKAAHRKLAQDMITQRDAARRADEANAARVAREQKQAIERTAHAYQVQLVDSRTALERLRNELDRAAASADDRGGGGTADVPGSLTARCRAYGAPDCDILLATLPGQLAAAEENTAKLISNLDGHGIGFLTG